MDSSRVSRGKNGTLKALRNFLVYTCSTVLIFQPFITPAFAQQIITDGRTQTQLVTKGSFTGITTTTIQNGNAFNSFSRFNVDQGNTVNLYIPDAADRLVNIVRDGRSDINGTLNSYRNGTIGGDVFFLNPHGIVVGSSGVINTGSLTLATPVLELCRIPHQQQGRDQSGRCREDDQRQCASVSRRCRADSGAGERA